MLELKCFKCGADNNFGNIFCTNCGEKFQYSCPKCNSNLASGAKFCNTCGIELDWESAAETTEADSITEKQHTTSVSSNKRGHFEESHPTKPKRNSLLLIIALILIAVCIAAIFTSDLFIKL